ncbi:hypothetical protein Nmel_006193 [Mimus melanotis]
MKENILYCMHLKCVLFLLNGEKNE